MNIQEWIDRIAAMGNPYYEWLSPRATPVQMGSTKQLPFADKLRGIKTRCQQCHWTAAQVVERQRECTLVQGFAMFNEFAIAHSWNEWRGIHFDLLAERRKKVLTFDEYAAVVTLSHKEMWELACETRRWDSYMELLSRREKKAARSA